MAWDKDTPAGSSNISAGDNTIRDNNAALETAIDLEHSFTTGGVQSGRHSFDMDTEANRDAPSTAYVDGGIFLATDSRTGKLVLQAMRSGAWENVDVNPKTGAFPTLPRLHEQSVFTVAQVATWATVAPVSGTPDTLAIDCSLSPAKYATIVGDTIISNPINDIASSTSTIQLELIMDGTGGYTITFGSEYRTPSGVTPIVASGANARTMLWLTRQQDGNWLVSTSSNNVAIV